MSESNLKEPRTATLMNQLKRSPVGRQLIALEASVGYPIPYRANNRSYVILPTYTRSPLQNGNFAVFPWVGGFTLDWLNGVLVEYVDFRFKGPWSSKIDFSKPLTVNAPAFTAESVQRGAAVAHMYDQLLDHLTLGDTPPATWIAFFGTALREVVEPEHIDFYRQIAPKFHDRFLSTRR